MSVVTLLTDFGTTDWFVGAMKGVLARLAPRLQIVDITHQVPPGDIRSGAFALAASYRFFPKGTVHLAVVDPGVGSQRTAIAVQTANYFFVGPDNGLLSWALKSEEIKQLRALENVDYFLCPISQTFHGRDIFAPVAAHLSRGAPIQRFGPARKDVVHLPWPEARTTRGRVKGEIAYIDRFGNGLTNLDNSILERMRGEGTLEVILRGRQSCQVAGFYGAAPSGRVIAVPGSTGFLEIAVNGGNAAKKLKLSIGDKVEVRQVLNAARIRKSSD